MTNETNMTTKGQRALTDLTILLDTLDIDHPDIVQDWIDRIAAALDERDALRASLRVLLDACDAQAFSNGVTGEVMTAMEETRPMLRETLPPDLALISFFAEHDLLEPLTPTPPALDKQEQLQAHYTGLYGGEFRTFLRIIRRRLNNDYWSR